MLNYTVHFHPLGYHQNKDVYYVDHVIWRPKYEILRTIIEGKNRQKILRESSIELMAT